MPRLATRLHGPGLAGVASLGEKAGDSSPQDCFLRAPAEEPGSRAQRLQTTSPMWILLALVLTVVTPGVSHAQQRFDFEWTSSTNVGLWPNDRTAVPAAVADRVLRGRGTLTLVANPMPGVAFAFDFRGPEGSGSGLVLPDQRTIDPNFAFPTVAASEPPAAKLKRTRAQFRLARTSPKSREWVPTSGPSRTRA